MADLRGFDASKVEPSATFEPIPPGKYVAVITHSEMKPTKAGNAHYLELVFQVIEGEHRNRTLWARLNLDHPNAQAVQIARAELSAICRAVRVMSPNDSTELHDLPFVIQVKCKKRADTGEIVNEIGGYSSNSQQPAAAPTASASSTPPWMRS